MTWKTPKTDWRGKDLGDDTYDIPGAGDFNRIEGNTEYLKEQTDDSLRRTPILMEGSTVTLGPGATWIIPAGVYFIYNNTLPAYSVDIYYYFNNAKVPLPGIVFFKWDRF